jgi:hypothetical protein
MLAPFWGTSVGIEKLIPRNFPIYRGIRTVGKEMTMFDVQLLVGFGAGPETLGSIGAFLEAPTPERLAALFAAVRLECGEFEPEALSVVREGLMRCGITPF